MKKLKGLMAFFLLASIGLLTVGQVKAADKPTVTTTTSFLYDMVNQLAGDKVNRELVIPAGEDPHVYVAKPQDLIKLEKADLVLYHGLHGRWLNQNLYILLAQLDCEARKSNLLHQRLQR